MSYTGTIQNGMVVLDNGGRLPEGARVRLEVLAAAAESPDEAWRKLAGAARGLPSDMARNHDHYLHGQAKK